MRNDIILKEFRRKLNAKKMCCVYEEGDDPFPCKHSKEYVISVLEEVLRGS